MEAYTDKRVNTLYIVIADESSGGNHSTYRYTGSTFIKVSDELSASEVKALYEANANTNVFTNAEKTKLGEFLMLTTIITKLILISLASIYGWVTNDLGTLATTESILLTALSDL